MIDNIAVKYFKCFRDSKFDLRSLTVISGMNSAGKSTVLQSLILLSDLLNDDLLQATVNLNRTGLRLGSAGEILNEYAPDNALSFGVTSGVERLEVVLEQVARTDLSFNLKSLTLAKGRSRFRYDPLRKTRTSLSGNVIQSLENLKWISSDRLGPRDLFPLKDIRALRSVGCDGRDAASRLFWLQENPVIDGLTLDHVPNTLYHQLQARLSEIFPGAEFKISRPDNGLSVALRFRASKKSDFRRLSNVGYGYSQIFPILVELLTAKIGDIVLIENPEVHLHPKAQQQLSFFIAQSAMAGVQVVVETHSDHVLNGVRLAVHRKVLDPNQVFLHFLSRNLDGEIVMESPLFRPNGKLSSWPDGFFDQYDIALSELL